MADKYAKHFRENSKSPLYKSNEDRIEEQELEEEKKIEEHKLKDHKIHCAISVIWTIVLITLFVCSASNPKVFSFVKNYTLGIASLAILLEIIVGFFTDPLRKKARLFLVIYLCPLALSLVGSAVMSNMEPPSADSIEGEISISSQIENMPPQIEDMSSQIEGMTSQAGNTFSGEWNLDDILFDDYSPEELQDHKVDCVDYIVDQVTTSNNRNYNENYPEYEKILSDIGDPESLYKLMVGDNLYKGNRRNKRIEVIDEAIDIRKNADQYHKSSLNQTLISARYFERAEENNHIAGFEKALLDYREAIQWQIKAIRTFRTEDENSKDFSLDEMVDRIISCYKNIQEICANTSYQKKADVLIDIYTSVKSRLAD